MLIRSPPLLVPPVLELVFAAAAAAGDAGEAAVGDDEDAVGAAGLPLLLLKSIVSMPSRDMIAFMFSG